MKKLVTASLVLALLAGTPLADVHAEKSAKAADKEKGGKGEKKEKGRKDKDNDDDDDDDKKGNGKGKDKKKYTDDAAGTQPADSVEDTVEPGTTDGTNPVTENPTEGTVLPGKKKAIQNAVKGKKELIELRQQLKRSTEITEELKAKYEELAEALEEVTELKQALEVQKELLDRFYKPGEEKNREMLKKLGKLYKKAGDTSLKAFVNGKEVEMDTKPFIEKGRAMVPVRAISAALKADVTWEADTRTVEVKRGENTITLNVDTGEAVVNGETIQLETAPVIRNGRVFLPLRFISEQLNAKVDYLDEGDLIVIEDPLPTDASDTAGETDETAGTDPAAGSDETTVTAPTTETDETAAAEPTTGTVPATGTEPAQAN